MDELVAFAGGHGRQQLVGRLHHLGDGRALGGEVEQPGLDLPVDTHTPKRGIRPLDDEIEGIVFPQAQTQHLAHVVRVGFCVHVEAGVPWRVVRWDEFPEFRGHATFSVPSGLPVRTWLLSAL